jgi:hypothetical protein
LLEGFSQVRKMLVALVPWLEGYRLKGLRKVSIGLGCLFALIISAAAYFWFNVEKYLPPQLIPPDAYWVDMDQPLRSQVRTVSIAGVRMAIPQMYIESKLSLKEERDSILLKVIWPEMKSVLELKNREEYEKMWRVERKSGQILLENRQKKTPFDQLLINMRKDLTKEEHVGKKYGLDVYIFQHGDKEPYISRKEIYLERNHSGHIETFILCSIKDKFRVTPVCQEKFFVGSLYFSISYNKENFLPEWRQQKQRAVEFINSFKVP